MKKVLKENKIVIGILIVIMILQVLGIGYAVTKREYFHIDEFYSHGLMQYKQAFIFDQEDFLNQWHDSEYFKDYVTVDEEEKWDYTRAYQNQIEDVHPPVYYLLLKFACGFALNELSVWPGTILNIILFLVSTILLFLIGKKVFKNSYYALLLCMINGFSLATVETVMYIRMYQLLILELLATIYWHLCMHEKEKLTLKQLLPLVGIVVLGFLTHYYYLIILAIVWFMMMIHYIKKRQKKNAIVYTGTLISAGLIGLILFPYVISHIFFGYRGQEMIDNLAEPTHLGLRILLNIKIIQEELFNGKLNILIVGLILLGVICLIYKLYVRYKEKKEIDVILKQAETSHVLKYIAIPLILYLLVIVIGAPYQDLRYLAAIIPLMFCTVLYVFRSILQSIFSKKTVFIIIATVCVLFSTTVIPHLGKNAYTYQGYKTKIELLQKEYASLPWIYIYEKVPMNKNKTMECYGALIEVENTYVMDYERVNAEEIKKVLANKDISKGTIFLMHMGNYNKAIDEIMGTGLFKTSENICLFGRYVVCLLK